MNRARRSYPAQLILPGGTSAFGQKRPYASVAKSGLSAPLTTQSRYRRFSGRLTGVLCKLMFGEFIVKIMSEPPFGSGRARYAGPERFSEWASRAEDAAMSETSYRTSRWRVIARRHPSAFLLAKKSRRGANVGTEHWPGGVSWNATPERSYGRHRSQPTGRLNAASRSGYRSDIVSESLMRNLLARVPPHARYCRPSGQTARRPIQNEAQDSPSTRATESC
jgi:hypothetical protein